MGSGNEAGRRPDNEEGNPGKVLVRVREGLMGARTGSVGVTGL